MTTHAMTVPGVSVAADIGPGLVFGIAGVSGATVEGVGAGVVSARAA